MQPPAEKEALTELCKFGVPDEPDVLSGKQSERERIEFVKKYTEGRGTEAEEQVQPTLTMAALLEGLDQFNEKVRQQMRLQDETLQTETWLETVKEIEKGWVRIQTNLEANALLADSEYTRRKTKSHRRLFGLGFNQTLGQHEYFVLQAVDLCWSLGFQSSQSDAHSFDFVTVGHTEERKRELAAAFGKAIEQAKIAESLRGRMVFYECCRGRTR
eukprot:s3789_g11.t1